MGCPGGFGCDCDCDCAWRREVHTPRFATAAANPFHAGWVRAPHARPRRAASVKHTRGRSHSPVDLNCGPARLDRVTLEEIKAVKVLRRWPIGAARPRRTAISEPIRVMTCYLRQSILASYFLTQE